MLRRQTSGRSTDHLMMRCKRGKSDVTVDLTVLLGQCNNTSGARVLKGNCSLGTHLESVGRASSSLLSSNRTNESRSVRHSYFFIG